MRIKVVVLLFLFLFSIGCSSSSYRDVDNTCFFYDKNYIFIKFHPKDNFFPLILHRKDNDIFIKKDSYRISNDTLYIKRIDENSLTITDYVEKPKISLESIKQNDKLQGFKLEELVNVIIYEGKTINKCNYKY